MTFDETICFIDKSFENMSICEVLGPNRDNFASVMKEISSQLKYTMEHDEQDCLEPEKLINDVNGIFHFLRSYYMNSPVKKEFSEFVLSYTMLIINWNNNILKNSEITDNFSFIYRIYDGKLVTEELYYFAKVLLDKFIEMKDFSAPSISLSKMYLDSLDKREG